MIEVVNRCETPIWLIVAVVKIVNRSEVFLQWNVSFFVFGTARTDSCMNQKRFWVPNEP
jgi:hypothetical protein